jgi:hypothetical protein
LFCPGEIEDEFSGTVIAELPCGNRRKTRDRNRYALSFSCSFADSGEALCLFILDISFFLGKR